MTTIKWYEHGNETQRKIALTFDDGPNPHFADAILQILEEKHVRGNFFVIGKWVERWPDLVKRTAQHHVVGNHSYSHEKPARDFEEAEAVIYKVLNRHTTFARAPYFQYTDDLLHWVGQRSLIAAGIDTRDWEATTTPEAIVDTVRANAKPGAIVVFHDGSEIEEELATRPTRMLNALPRVIDYLQEQGYSLVGLDEMNFINP